MTDHDRALQAIQRGATIAHWGRYDWLRDELEWAYRYLRDNGNGKAQPLDLAEHKLPHCQVGEGK